MIGPRSRYASVEHAVLATASGRSLPYLRRRFIPAPDPRDEAATVEVGLGARLDGVAASLGRDPADAWRIADANGALDPVDLVATPGRVLRAPRPGI